MKKKDKVTEAELAFYRKHPELVHAFGDKTTIHRFVLIAVFVVGFLLVAASKVIKYIYGDASAPGVELTVDLIFELGVALWGGVATTVLLQNYVEKKHREGRQYQREIMRQLAGNQNKDQEEGQS